MVSSGLLRRVALVRTDVSKEPGASFIRVTKIGELGTTQAATSNRRTLQRVRSSPILLALMKEALSSSETSVLTRATWRNIPEDSIPYQNLSLGKQVKQFNYDIDIYCNSDSDRCTVQYKKSYTSFPFYSSLFILLYLKYLVRCLIYITGFQFYFCVAKVKVERDRK
jgi:hypothetical protein